MSKIPLTDVKNDLKWMRTNSRTWLSDHALNGFVFATQNTIEQLLDIEVELQSLRSKESDIELKLKIIKELKDTINMRWVIQGDGPTLMAQKYADRQADNPDGR